MIHTFLGVNDHSFDEFVRMVYCVQHSQVLMLVYASQVYARLVQSL